MTDTPDRGEPFLHELPADPVEARALLKARLVGADRAPDDVVHRSVLPGIEAVLVFDLPDRLVPLAPEDLPALLDSVELPDAPDAVTDEDRLDALWDEAYEHVRHEHPEIDVEELTEGVPVMLVHGESYFVATNALWVDQFVDVPADGLLFAVPHRHLLLLHPVRDQAATYALPNLLLLARENHAQGQGPVSPDVFWWHDGEVHTIGVTETIHGEEVHLQIDLPAGLASVFASWAEPGAAPPPPALG